MKSPLLRYYWTAVYASLAPYIWLAILAGGFCLPAFLDYQGIGESKYMQPLLRSQIVLYVVWFFIVLQGGYWWAKFAHDRRHSGLSVWWSAQGIAPLRQYRDLLFSALVPCILYALLAMGVLFAWSFWDERPVPAALLLEQASLIIMACLLFGGVMVLLGTKIEPALAMLFGVALVFFSIQGVQIARQLITNLSGSMREAAAWLLLVVPNFDLFFRVGAVIHFWPPLELNVWLGLLLYTIIFQIIFLVLASRLFRPCYN
jgi:hypothetical protein